MGPEGCSETSVKPTIPHRVQEYPKRAQLSLMPRRKPENRLLCQFSLCHCDRTPYRYYKVYRSFISPQPPTKFYLSSFESQHSEEAGCVRQSIDWLRYWSVTKNRLRLSHWQL